MRREIKFRAWDLVEEKFVGSYINGYYMNYENGQVYSGNLNITSHLELMQFTGLRDKNGKEIYEGDIYKWNSNTYLVIWDNGYHWQKIYDSWLEKNVFGREEKSWLSECDSKGYEIIGNIYENPELIEVK